MVGNLLHFSTPNQSNIANQDRNQINVTQNASSSSERSYLQWAVLSNDILFSMLFNFFSEILNISTFETFVTADSAVRP